MKAEKLHQLIQQGGIESYTAGQIFYSLDFKEELYIVKSGYVKRYSVLEDKSRVIESIYGPGYIFPLSAVFTKLLHFSLSQENNTYVYQAMTDLEIQGISIETLSTALESDTSMYADLFYEAGRRLKANISRLASNALRDDYKKVAHQIAYLAEEFGDVERQDVKTGIKIPVPLEAIDMAEQLNINPEVAQEAMDRLIDAKLIVMDDRNIVVPDADLLKDAYLPAPVA